MAKLTRTQRSELMFALRNAERAHAYLHDARRAICNRGDMATTSLHYTRQDGATLYELAKHSSDIEGLDSAIQSLKILLARD